MYYQLWSFYKEKSLDCLKLQFKVKYAVDKIPRGDQCDLIKEKECLNQIFTFHL